MSINRYMKLGLYKLLIRPYGPWTRFSLSAVSWACSGILLMTMLSIPLPSGSLTIPESWLLLEVMWLLCNSLLIWLSITAFVRWIRSPRSKNSTLIHSLIAWPIWRGFVAAFVAFQLLVYTTPHDSSLLSAEDWHLIQLTCLSLAAPFVALVTMKLFLRLLRTMLTISLMR